MIGHRLYSALTKLRSSISGRLASPDLDTYLFVPINGAGLGHLTRCLAVARRLERLVPDADIVFFTTSVAVPLVNRFGYRCYHLPPLSAGKADGVTPERWNSLFFDCLAAVMNLHRPSTVVFDGTWPYAGLRAVMHSFRRSRYVWIRRGLHRQQLQPEQEKQQLALFDLTIEPGEKGDKADPQSPAAVERVDPIVLLDRDEVLPRAEARKRLRLDQERAAAYVQLGAGNINDLVDLEGRVVKELKSIDGLQVVVARSPIMLHERPETGADAELVDYPNSRLFRAFDVAVLAAGYNSVYESMLLGLPAVFLPNLDTGADDQRRRARMAAEYRGWCCLEDSASGSVARCVRTLLANVTADPLLEGPSRNGAEQAARLVAHPQAHAIQ